MTNGYLPVFQDNWDFPLPLAVLQHFLHARRVEFHIKVDMDRMRLTGTGGVRSALLSIDDDLAHNMPPRIGCEEKDSLHFLSTKLLRGK